MADSTASSLLEKNQPEAPPASVSDVTSSQEAGVYQPVEQQTPPKGKSAFAGTTRPQMESANPKANAKMAVAPEFSNKLMKFLVVAALLIFLLIGVVVFLSQSLFKGKTTSSMADQVNQNTSYEEQIDQDMPIDEVFESTKNTDGALHFSGQASSGESLMVSVIQSPTVGKTVFTAQLTGVYLAPNEAYYLWVRDVENDDSEYQEGFVGSQAFEVSKSTETDSLYTQLVIDALVPLDSEMVITKETKELPLYPEGTEVLRGRAE